MRGGSRSGLEPIGYSETSEQFGPGMDNRAASGVADKLLDAGDAAEQPVIGEVIVAAQVDADILDAPARREDVQARARGLCWRDAEEGLRVRVVGKSDFGSDLDAQPIGQLQPIGPGELGLKSVSGVA